MGLPIRTTLDDIQTVCKYLASKPTGATVPEAKKVIDPQYLDGRKMMALKRWGLIEIEDGQRLRVTEEGRRLAKDYDKNLPSVLRRVIGVIPPYHAIIERAAHRGEESLSATDVGAIWHEHFPEETSENEKILNDQAVCFFQIVDGAGLGKLVIGRKGSPTRVDFHKGEVEACAGTQAPEDMRKEAAEEKWDRPPEIPHAPTLKREAAAASSQVFITHGKNKKILGQLKDIVTFGKFMPVVAEEHETPSKPVPEKVMDDMRSCFAGIIHVAGEQALIDDQGKKHYRINENVLIEIGAAMALYGRNFILLVEKGVQLPSNLQGLYECRYEGEKLDGDATMKLLKAFNEFRLSD